MSKKKTKVTKQDLIGEQLDNDAAIIQIDEDSGEIILVHAEGFLSNGHGVRFNGAIRLPLKYFEWID